MYQTTQTQTNQKKLRFKKRSKRKSAIPRRKQHKSVARKYKGGEPFDFTTQLTKTQTNTPYLIDKDKDTNLTEAYFLKFPAEIKNDTYFVFEKTYDCSLFENTAIKTVIENYTLDEVVQNRWMGVKNRSEATLKFDRDGSYNIYKMMNRLPNHHVYMVYVVETPNITDWFTSNSIDGKKIHITMLAFVPKKDYDKKPCAVHFYIEKNIWMQSSPIRGLGVMLHGFSATMVRHITKEKDIRIVSSPNKPMLAILTHDMEKHPDYYKLDTDTPDTQNSPEQLTQDFEFDKNGEQITYRTVPYSFAPGSPISIHSARLENRFKAIYNTFASKCKIEYFNLMEQPAPPGYLENIVNVSDSLKHRQLTINILKNVSESFKDRQPTINAFKTVLKEIANVSNSLEDIQLIINLSKNGAEVLQHIVNESGRDSLEHRYVTLNVLENVLKEYELTR